MRRTSSACESGGEPDAGRTRPSARANARLSARTRSGAGGLVVLVEEGQSWGLLSGDWSSQDDRAIGGNYAVAAKSPAMEITDELPAPLAADLVLNRYRLGQRLGAGGFGTVYAATDERLQRAVAVKVIPSGGGGDPTRAQREALAAGRLDHPGIVAIFDAGQDEQARYLVSELVHGPHGRRPQRRRPAQRPRRAARSGSRCAARSRTRTSAGSCTATSSRRTCLIPDAPRSAAGVAKLADFGVAHLAGDEPLTRTGDVVGTLAYMAPEQAAGKRIDHRCDLYSLAIVLYEALAGVQPGPRRLARGDRQARRHRAPAAAAPAQGPPAPSCAPRSTAPLRPKPAERGTLEELADALADALPRGVRRGRHGRRHPLDAPRRAAAGCRAGPRRRRRGRRCARSRWPGREQPAVARARRRRRPSRCSRAPAGSPPRWRRSPRSRSSEPGAALLAGLALAPVAAAPAPPRHDLVAARRRAAARPGDARRRLPGARGPRAAAGSPAPRSARSAPGGRCWPRRCWAARPARPEAPRGSRRRRAASTRRSTWCSRPLFESGVPALRGALGRRRGGPALDRARPLARDRRRRRLRVGRRARGRDGRRRRRDRRSQSHATRSLASVVAGVFAVAIPHLRRARVVEP